MSTAIIKYTIIGIVFRVASAAETDSNSSSKRIEERNYLVNHFTEGSQKFGKDKEREQLEIGSCRPPASDVCYLFERGNSKKPTSPLTVSISCTYNPVWRRSVQIRE